MQPSLTQRALELAKADSHSGRRKIEVDPEAKRQQQRPERRPQTALCYTMTTRSDISDAANVIACVSIYINIYALYIYIYVCVYINMEATNKGRKEEGTDIRASVARTYMHAWSTAAISALASNICAS